MGSRLLVIPALFASLTAAAGSYAQTADWRPTLEVVVDNRGASSAVELGTARARARFIFGEAGIHLTFVTQGEVSDVARNRLDRIHLIVLDQAAGDRLITGDARRLGFAIPSANRVYVHYDRVHALARYHHVQPGWFLGVVIAHELTHVLLPRVGHTDAGVMAGALSPNPKALPVFTRQEAQLLRERLREETTLAQR
jgi:hypothetical protein